MLDSLDENLSNESTATKLSVLTVLEKQVYDIIKQHNGITPDEMASLGIKIEDVLSTLTLLEIYCLVTAIPGGKYIAIK